MAAVIACDRCTNTGVPTTAAGALPEGWSKIKVEKLKPVAEGLPLARTLDLCGPCTKRVEDVLAPVTRPNTPRNRSASTTDDEKAVSVATEPIGAIDAPVMHAAAAGQATATSKPKP